MKGKALLFGLNYAHCPSGQLSGCINDVANISAFLQKQFNMPVTTYTDDIHRSDTSGIGIMRRLYELALESYRDNLEFVWIHYSGHGSYIRDATGDEKDGKDECLVPSDYETNGLLPDDYLQSLFRYFNPKTRVICVFDCCHSGTIGDVKYSWEGPSAVQVENVLCRVPAKMITISGCLDTQTSADAYNVLGDNKYVGALTACMLIVLKKNPALARDVFAFVKEVRAVLKEKRYVQVPKLCSTYNLAKDRMFLPSA